MASPGIQHIRMKNWKAECPKCHHIEFSAAMGDGVELSLLLGKVGNPFDRLFVLWRPLS